MSSNLDFGSPDPGLTLGEAPSSPAPLSGLIRALEFVVEIAGPRSVPAAAADVLLTREWQGALGGPKVWAMAPADTQWTPLAAGRGGSYDSLALSYPLLDPRGILSSKSADALVHLAEGFANQIGRRAMPMPVPADVDAIARGLLEIRESLDVGYGIAVAFGHPTTEEQLWRQLVALGLTLDPQGAFVWGSEGILSVTPTDPPEQFMLRGVQAGRMMTGVSIGFSIPRSPSPSHSLHATLRVAAHLRQAFGGIFVDEDGNPVMPNEAQLASFVAEAHASLERTGILPGSSEALALFDA